MGVVPNFIWSRLCPDRLAFLISEPLAQDIRLNYQRHFTHAIAINFFES